MFKRCDLRSRTKLSELLVQEVHELGHEMVLALTAANHTSSDKTSSSSAANILRKILILDLGREIFDLKNFVSLLAVHQLIHNVLSEQNTIAAGAQPLGLPEKGMSNRVIGRITDGCLVNFF